MAISDWSATPANNNASPPTGAPEGMAAASVNDTMREMMADIKAGSGFPVDTIADMTALTVARLGDNNYVAVAGYSAIGDGGGGDFYWNALSTATAFNGFVMSADELGTGRWIRILENNTFNELMAGAVSDATTDDTAAIQNLFDFAESIITADITDKPNIEILDVPLITSTVTLIADSGGNLPSLVIKKQILFDGTNDQAALKIGATGQFMLPTKLDLSVVNNNQSDWTNTANVGIQVLNANGFPDLIIRRVQGFTYGFEGLGDTAGFAHNRIALGWVIDNKAGVSIRAINNGFANENKWNDGRFGSFSGVNITVARVGFRLDGSDSVPVSSINNNVFNKPSFELNNTQAAGLGTGLEFIDASNNRVFEMRNEDTFNIVNFDDASSENRIEVGFSDAGSRGVIDAAFAGNVVTQSRVRHEYNSKVIYSANNLKDQCALDSTFIIPSGMETANTGTGALANFLTGTFTANSIVLQDASRALGVVVNTEQAKKFTLSVGFEGTDGGRMFILCFDGASALLQGAAPFYATGTSNATLAVNGVGYRTGSDTQENRSVRFHDDVKSAFIGILTGAADTNVNSYRLLAQDTTFGVENPAVLGTEQTSSRSPFFRYGTAAPTAGTWKAGDIVWDTTPTAAGTIGWVCTVAGTPGTWKTFGAITA